MFFRKKESQSSVDTILSTIEIMTAVEKKLEDRFLNIYNDIENIKLKQLEMKKEFSRMYLLAQEACSKANAGSDVIEKLLAIKNSLDKYQTAESYGLSSIHPETTEA